MCYTGCKYENRRGHPDNRGECTIGPPYPKDAHCFEEDGDDHYDVEDALNEAEHRRER